jgi:carbon monoxide dehydrogenase subunit G
MATITRAFTVPVPPDDVWAALADFTNVHTQLATGFVVASVAEEGGAVRRITFANGLEARERLVTSDAAGRRLVYAVEGGRPTHYNAAVQVLPDGGSGSRFIWTVDLLPDALAPAIAQMMDMAMPLMQKRLAQRAAR